MRFVGKNVSVEYLDDTGVDYGNNPPPTVVVVDTRGIDNGVTPTVTELTESHDLFREVQKDVKEAIATHSDFVALEHLSTIFQYLFFNNFLLIGINLIPSISNSLILLLINFLTDGILAYSLGNG